MPTQPASGQPASAGQGEGQSATGQAGAGAAPVLAGTDLLRVGALGWIAPGLALPGATPLPLVDPAAADPAAGALRRLAARGKAAGFEGVLYDNRDRGHSTLPQAAFPALAHLAYAPELVAAGLDYGLAGNILLPSVTLGNSSTAVTNGPRPRSLPRLAMTAPGGAAASFRLYAANQLYVYPEHRDHDEADLFPALWPYMVVSQGSSGSDQPFLRALALTLAAFAPDTRARLAAQGLVAPTLQMILHRSLRHVASRAAYLSGAAHPSALEAAALSPERMVAIAAAMRPGDIPPLVRLRVETEDFADAAGLAGLSERLYDTPAAIARVWRGPAFRQTARLSAGETRDANGRDANGGALTFSWVLLRGDPARVTITPLDAAGTQARVEIDWHEARAISPQDPRLTARVDIGVFAFNGVHDSAPAVFSVSFPVHEQRTYVPGADGAMMLAAVDYDALGRGAAYDPALHWSAPWRDVRDVREPGGWLRMAAAAAPAAGASVAPAPGASVAPAPGVSVAPAPGTTQGAAQPAGAGAGEPVALDALMRPLAGPYRVGGDPARPVLSPPGSDPAPAPAPDP